MAGTFKRWWYGPMYWEDSVDHTYHLAPMTWDLADLDRVRALLGAVGPTRLITNSEGRMIEVEPESIYSMGPMERLNLSLTAANEDGTNVVLSLGDYGRSRLSFGPYGSNPPVVARQTASGLVADLEANAMRRVPRDRRLLHGLTLLGLPIAALVVWALAAAWHVSVPLALLLTLLTAAVGRSAWREVRLQINNLRLSAREDWTMIKMTTRSQGDLAWEVKRRERHARLWTAVIAVIAAAVSATVTVLIRGGK